MKEYVPLQDNFIFKDNTFDGFTISCCNKEYSLVNFSPGPAPIPKDVFKDLEGEIFSNVDYVFGNTPLEMSHRSPEFNSILKNLNQKIRNFMEIPNCFNIIWTQGGGHGQFSAIPLNMKTIDNFKKAGYIVNGTWSLRAYNEAKRFIDTTNILENYYKDINVMEYKKLPESIEIPDGLDYVYLCSNETVNGIEFKNSYLSREQLKGAKLIIDMSSDFLMKKINWHNLDIAFACTSKNMGIAGANILIIRKDIIDELKDVNRIPCTQDWKLYDKNESMYNTPAIFNLYLLDKIMNNYKKKMDTIDNMNKYSETKSSLIYNFLDKNEIFKPVIQDISSRSIVNVPFIVDNGNEETMSNFLEFCYYHNVVGVRTLTPFSYKTLGLVEPLRISLYNGISINDVKYMIEIMKLFIINIKK